MAGVGRVQEQACSQCVANLGQTGAKPVKQSNVDVFQRVYWLQTDEAFKAWFHLERRGSAFQRLTGERSRTEVSNCSSVLLSKHKYIIIYIWSVPRLSLRFYSLTPTFVKYDGSTNRKWHRSLWIWLQQVWQRWWAGHFDSIIWIACHFSEDVSTYQEYVAMYQEHVWTHLKKLLQRISTVWQVTVRRGDTCIRKVVQFTYK